MQHPETTLEQYSAELIAGLLIAYSPSYLPRLLRSAGFEVGIEGPPAVIVWNWLAVGGLLAFWVGMAFSFTLFVLPHVTFFGPYWLVSNGVSVVLVYMLYAWRRNLWACMLMHLLGNAMILLPATGLVG